MKFRSLGFQRCAVALAAVLLVSACTEDGRQVPLSGVESIDIPVADVDNQNNQNISNPTLEVPVTFQVADGDLLTLVWNDEFDGAQLDPEVWFYEIGDGTQYGIPFPSWGNNELQYYLPDNVQLDGGKLQITARRESAEGFSFTSGRTMTRDRFAFKYGRIEASIKLPSGQGLWPAFWMLPQDDVVGSAPGKGRYGVYAQSGEIDIVEAINLGANPTPAGRGGGNEIFSTIHFGGDSSVNQNLSAETLYTPSFDVTADFHTYAFEWDEFEMRWFVDGTLYKMENFWSSAGGAYPAPFDQPFYVLFNLAVGGSFPGSPDGTTPSPATLEVDWVRVYSGADNFVPADRGTVPDDVIYASDPNEVIDIVFGEDYTGFEPFGSGSSFNNENTSDRDFSPAFSVTTGSDYGAQVGQLGIVGFTPGFATGYESLQFKAKNLNNDLIRVKFDPAGSYVDVDLASSGYSTALGNGWYEVIIPIADFTGVDSGTTLVFETDNTSANAFTFLLTDLGFSGTAGGGGNPGTTPDFVLYGTTAPADVAIPAGGPTDFGSGATFNFAFAGDASFNPAIAVTAGTNYGADVWVAFVAVPGYAAPIAAGFDTFNVKVKDSPDGQVEVKLIGNGDDSGVIVDVSTYAGSTDLGDGWYELSIPFSEFSNAANIPGHTGWLVGPPGDQGDAAFVFLLTDVGFSGDGGGGGNTGTTPEFVLYGTTAPADVAIPASGPTDFGSGATFNFAFAGDAAFNPAIAVTAGMNYGADVWVAFVAVPDYAAPIAVGYDTFNVKVKDSPDGQVEVKLIGNGDDSGVIVNVASYAGSTDLGDGWYELSIPFSELSNAANIPGHTGWLVGPPGDQGDAAFVFLLTDVGFSNTGGGGGGGTGTFVNGDFETGDFTGWTAGIEGSVSIVNDTLDGRTSNFARLQTTAAPQDVLLSQVALGAGTIVSGDMIDVSFDLYGTLTGDSGVVFVEVIFLNAAGQDEGGRNFVGPAAPYFPTTTWTNNSGTVTAGLGANGTQYDVSGGVTLQLKAACGGVPGCVVDAYLDNVTFTVNGQ